jgi:cobalt/nickel transport system permease protein
MHLAEGLLPAPQAGVYFLLAAPFLVSSFKQIKVFLNKKNPKERAFLHLSIALCFAVTLIPIPSPFVMVTTHMCATPFLALFFGPRLMVLPVALVLLLQAAFFAHGGLTTLGANVLTLGVIGPLVAWGAHYIFARLRIPLFFNIGLSCFLGSISVYIADSIILAVALAGSESFTTWFIRIGLALMPVQGPLSIVEGVLSALFLRSISSAKLLPIPQRVALVLPMLFLLFHSVDAFAYEALDEVVFTKLAAEGGRQAQGFGMSLDGELLLTMFSFGMFIAGLIVGKNWGELKNLTKGKE